jgi:bifunctional UDP-N-acetylglucosamine pyrophosphorylase / glucosamine-1-phosphate N-acetyltransferase
MAKNGFSVLILAAGKATRFKSERSKVLHRLAGRPLGEYVLRAASALEPAQTLMVIGHDAEEVRKTFERPGLTFIEQKEQLGTGHAVMAARDELLRSASPTLLVLAGDVPLVRPETLRGLVEAHQRSRAAATVLTTRLDDPTGYGRIIRGPGNRMRAIVEEKMATPAQKKIREVNTALLCFSLPKLLAHLDKLSAKNSQKEYLLTDLVGIFNRHREKAFAFPAADPREVLGVNDRVELAKIEKILRQRKAEALMREGVTILDPDATYIDEDVEVGGDTVIEPGVSLLGKTRVGSACILRPYSTVADSLLGDHVTVRPCSVITGCEIASDAIIGPFAHLRDGAVIEEEARIGNFVEVKKSRVGRGTKASHLAYLGDATLGREVNIGAGTVTCNYDGKKKNPTVIEDGSFIGSGTMLVAPVRVGKNSIVGAGSTITEDVPADSLALGRARQVNKEGWVEKQGDQPGHPSAISTRQAGSVTIFDVTGKLTSGGLSEELRKRILATRNAGRVRVLVNLAQVVRADRAGMEELVGAMKVLRESGGELKLSDMQATVLGQFEAAHLDTVFEIHPHEAAALASFRKEQTP